MYIQNTVSGWELVAGTSFATNPATDPLLKSDPMKHPWFFCLMIITMRVLLRV